MTRQKITWASLAVACIVGAAAILGNGCSSPSEAPQGEASKAIAPAAVAPQVEASQEVDSKAAAPVSVAKQVASYPLSTCVVSGKKLGGMGDSVDYVHDNRLVRFCCKSCVATFEKEPAKYLALLDAAKTGMKMDTKPGMKMDMGG